MSPEQLIERENQLDAADGIRHAFAQVNGLKLHYACRGDPSQPLMLFVHGFPEFWYEWRELMMAFSDRYFAVALDMRGFNLSDKPASLKEYRAKHILEDLRQLILHLGKRDCILVGHDWGGALTWGFAAQQPAMVSRFIAINAAHTWVFAQALAHDPGQQAASAYMLRFRQPGMEEELSRDQCAALFDKLGRDGQPATWLDAAARARYLANWQAPGSLTGGLNYYRASPMTPPGDREPGTASLQLDREAFKVKVPTLVIWGEQDRALLPCLLEGLDEFVADLRIARNPQGSHWIIHEQPDWVHTTMRNWLDTIDAR